MAGSASTVKARARGGNGNDGSASPLVVIAATWFELAGLCDALGAGTAGHRGATRWPEVRRHALAGGDLMVCACGVGKANAAAAVAALSARARPRAVLQLGIGGAYPSPGGSEDPALGGVAVAASEFDLDLGVVGAGDAHVEGSWAGLDELGFAVVAGGAASNRFACDAALSRAVADALGARLLPFATSDAVSADVPTAAARAARSGASIESMEGAAAAQACLNLGVPFVEVRAVSNEAGIRDKRRWRTAEAVAALGGAGLLALATMAEQT